MAFEDADLRLRTLLDGATRDRAGTLAALHRFDSASLSASARLDLETARAGLAIDAELARCFPSGRLGKSPYLVTPGSGAWMRSDASPQAIRRDTAALLADAARGVRLPQGLIERTLAAVATSQRSARGERAAALAEQVQMLQAQAAGAPPPGVRALPDGTAYYALLLRRFAGDDVEPTGLWRRLEAERDRTLARADALFARIGRRRGSVGQRYSALWHDPRWLYSDDDAGRDRAVADMNRTLDVARGQLRQHFGPLPATVLDVRARRMSPTDEAAGRQGYREVPAAGRPGSYFVDLKEIRRRPRWTLPAVVHHELLPGHMVQLPMEAAAAQHPLRIEYVPAFAEGWAIHAEKLAAYPDPLDELGLCHWRLFRIARALADLGIHLHGWSLETALGHWRDWMGEPAYFAPFPTDLDRIALEPAMRAAEAAVWLTIEDLGRDRPAIAFHHILLDHGRMRTDTLRKAAGDAL